MEPENPELIQRKAKVDLMRSNNQPTVPTKVGIEKKTNPFLRPNSEEIKINLKMTQASDTEVFAEIRKGKDNF